MEGYTKLQNLPNMHFFKKRSFRYEKDDEKSKTIVFKVRFLKMVVFIKLVVLLTIVNDDPSLTEGKPT